MADYSSGTQPGRFLVAPPPRRACVYRPHSPPPESDQRGSPEGRGRDPRRRSVTGNMASKAKKRAVGNGVQRPLEAPSQREEEEEDELEDEEEEEEEEEVLEEVLSSFLWLNIFITFTYLGWDGSARGILLMEVRGSPTTFVLSFCNEILED